MPDEHSDVTRHKVDLSMCDAKHFLDEYETSTRTHLRQPHDEAVGTWMRGGEGCEGRGGVSDL